jgi:hypothetical protein
VINLVWFSFIFIEKPNSFVEGPGYELLTRWAVVNSENCSNVSFMYFNGLVHVSHVELINVAVFVPGNKGLWLIRVPLYAWAFVHQKGLYKFSLYSVIDYINTSVQSCAE